ncbi:phenylacetate--CoA ligase family protein [Chloroflexus sp.]|uniref:phenylacetate--CoA ligase family protein n=1 Tax=Chloroflexus sp. TaxID=1904827 RepID=UPI00261B5A41|nr:AMP-binding protein [uncultured Chloroflexus sp.]
MKLLHLPAQQQIYDAAPRWLQRVLVNAEAARREWFRRHGDYRRLVAAHDPRWYYRSRDEQEAWQLAQLNRLLAEARRRVPYYRRTLPDRPLSHLSELSALPLLSKEQIRRDPFALVADDLNRRALWPRKTSGSTGTPLTFYLDREATRNHQAPADAMLVALGCRFGEPRARFSGAYVTPYSRTQPPFWIWIDLYRQLQCSAYHLAPQFYPHYLRALRESGVVYGTGYPTSWHLLATYILESGDQPPRLRAIISDSEGISREQQAVVEQAFGCPMVQTYGAGEIGQMAWQCEHGRYHALSRAAIAEVVDANAQPVAPGETGQIVVTSFASTGTPFIRYQTGDLAMVAADDCPCGRHNPSWLAIEGRIDDRIKTPDGRWIGRLSHVTKPGVGIKESQIAQVARDRIVIRVVPASDFVPASMQAVIEAARRYLGPAMQIEWETVERLPRTSAGKLRHVVREVDLE